MQNTETDKTISPPYRVRRWSRKRVQCLLQAVSGRNKSKEKRMEFYMMYELRYGDYAEQSEDRAKLKAKASRTSLPWTICRIEISKVDDAIKEIELFGNDGIETLMKDLSKGMPAYRLAIKYHTSHYTISKYIRKYRSEHESLK
jgi:hypothetical protein